MGFTCTWKKEGGGMAWPLHHKILSLADSLGARADFRSSHLPKVGPIMHFRVKNLYQESYKPYQA